MTDIILNKNNRPEAFKEYNTFCYKNVIPDGSFVNEGDDIINVWHDNHEPFFIKAPVSGYFYWAPIREGWAECLPITVGHIYSKVEDRLIESYATDYSIETDEFTGESFIKWNHILGGGFTSGHSISSFNLCFIVKDELPHLEFEFEPSDIKISNNDEFTFLFEDGEKISYRVVSKPIKKYSFAQSKTKSVQFLLSEEDLLRFSTIGLESLRITFADGKKTETIKNQWSSLLNVAPDYPFSKEKLKYYASVYTKALNECGISFKRSKSSDSLTTKECETASAADPCYVYLMIDTTNGYHKIGISNHPEYREHTLQSEKPTIELLGAKQYPNRAIAEAIEAALHKVYAEKRIRGEWFNLSYPDIADLKKVLCE